MYYLDAERYGDGKGRDDGHSAPERDVTEHTRAGQIGVLWQPLGYVIEHFPYVLRRLDVPRFYSNFEGLPIFGFILNSERFRLTVWWINI